MSFFDEDDEPTRRSRESRPRPRRAAAARAGGGTDQQTLMIRRGVALGIAVLVLILLVIAINSCQNSRHKDSLRSWNQNAQTLVSQSDGEVGRQLFATLRRGSSQSPEDLQTQVSSLRAEADTQLQRAKQLDTPSELSQAANSLLIALELRRDGLDYIARRLAPALGNQGDVADAAIRGIAGQMQGFLASDVLIRSRVTPVARQELKSNDIVTAPVATSGFLKSFAWLNPDFVAGQLGTRLAAPGGGRQGGKIAPGLHGDGLTSTVVNGVTLQPDPAANKVSATGDLTFHVTFQNQGDNDEFNVPVTVTLQGSGRPIVGKKTVDTIAKGASATVNIALPQKPQAGEVYTVNVEVKPVPGEKNTTNNKSTYNVLFQ